MGDVFRGRFQFRNSDAAILRFPFPFAGDRHAYSVNLEPHARGEAGSAYAAVFDLDEHYLAECEERALVLEKDPGRCQVLPHMDEAQWDALELMMEALAADYPQHFALTREGERWTWTNRLLGIHDRFVFGDPASLPRPPFEYIARQLQGDFTLQDQRDGTLFLDGGMTTTQAGWSLAFNLGMDFAHWHRPVPIAGEAGVFDRALKYLLNLQAGAPVRRLNWSMTVHPRLDTALEVFDVWGPERATVTPANVGQRLYLRVELQTLFRLPRSDAILFGIRCYLISLAELSRVPNWRKRLHRALRDLEPEVIEYKGLGGYLKTAIDYLRAGDDGADLPPGTGSGLTDL